MLDRPCLFPLSTIFLEACSSPVYDAKLSIWRPGFEFRSLRRSIMTEDSNDLNVTRPEKMRQTSEYSGSEIDYFIVEEEDGSIHQCWTRKVDNGGRPLGSSLHDTGDIRMVAELTASDEDLSRGEIAERVGASKSWVQDRQRELLFL